jgi:hypothetical protein
LLLDMPPARQARGVKTESRAIPVLPNAEGLNFEEDAARSRAELLKHGA